MLPRSGLATVTFENDRLYLRGPRNKAGKDAIREISGRKFHPADGTTKAAWSVPASSAKAFREAVITHWPNFTGLEEAIAQASAVAAPADATVTYVTPLVPGWVQVKTPYNAGFVADVESLPYKSRRWNGDARVWEVEDRYLTQLTAMVSKYYGASA